jgi:IS30 family transposase
MEAVFQLTRSELAATLHAVLDERERQRFENSKLKTISIHAAARRLGRADLTIKRLVKKGIIPSTPDGRIPIYALDEYVNQTKNL